MPDGHDDGQGDGQGDARDDGAVDPPDLIGLADPLGPSTPAEAVRNLIIDLGLSTRAVALTGIVVALLAGGAWWWWHDPPPTAAEAALPLASPPSSPGEAATSGEPLEVVAHAAGAVADPGVYTLAAGARVADLIDAAGGAVGEADLDRVNLAAPLGDGAQVYVPLLGEATAAPPVGGEGVAEGGQALVDINTAGPEVLESLPGVGPATSAAIVQHREENGPFAAVDELIAVRGIGEAKLASMRELVTV